MKKQLIAIGMAVLLCIGMIPMSALADGSDDNAAQTAAAAAKDQTDALGQDETPEGKDNKDSLSEDGGYSNDIVIDGQTAGAAGGTGEVSFNPYVFTVDENTNVSAAVALQPKLMQIAGGSAGSPENAVLTESGSLQVTNVTGTLADTFYTNSTVSAADVSLSNITGITDVTVANTTGITDVTLSNITDITLTNSTGITDVSLTNSTGTAGDVYGSNSTVVIAEEVETNLISASYTYNGTAEATFTTTDINAGCFELYAYTATDPGDYFDTLTSGDVLYYMFGLMSFSYNQEGLSISNITTSGGPAIGVTLSTELYCKEDTVLPPAGSEVFFAIETENGGISNLVGTTVQENPDSPLPEVTSISDGNFVATIRNETETFIFNGGTHNPDIIIYNNITKEELIPNVDYVVIYDDNINAGLCNETISGKGMYIDNLTLSFYIQPCELTPHNTIVELEDAVDNTYIYNGTEINPSFSVHFYSEMFNATLTEGYDYVYELIGNEEPGPGRIEVYGQGNYAGNVTQEFLIQEDEKISLDSDYTSIQVSPYSDIYTGENQTRAVTVSYEGIGTLTEGTDYDLVFENNLYVGEAAVTVVGKGNYIDNKTAMFEIRQAPISSENTTVTVDADGAVYAGGSEVRPAVTVTYRGITLDPDREFELAFTGNTVAGNASVIVISRSTGDFSGNITREFQIRPASLTTGTEVVLTPNNVTYSGEAELPEVTVTHGGKQLNMTTDYSVMYPLDTNAGDYLIQISGNGNYCDIVNATFTITPADLDYGNVTVELDKEKYVYNGEEIEPQVKVYREGVLLELDKDFDVEYKNNKDAGTGGSIVITAKGNYQGSVTENFTIEKLPVTSEEISIELSNTSMIYTGEALEPEVTVSYNGRKLEKGKDYTVTYDNNKEIGTGCVKINGIGNFDGEKVVEFVIRAAEQYSVTFDANGGGGSMGNYTAVEGQPFTLPECGFTPPEGQEFDAWDKGDPQAQISITEDTVIKAQWKDRNVEYSVIKVENQTWKGSGNITATIDAPYSKLLGVDVDNVTLSKPGQYVDEEGSTIIRLQESFLKTLAAGEHIMTAHFTDGKASVKFWIMAADNIKTPDKGRVNSPATGDNNSMLLWMVIFIVAAACGTSMVPFMRRRRHR